MPESSNRPTLGTWSEGQQDAALEAIAKYCQDKQVTAVHMLKPVDSQIGGVINFEIDFAEGSMPPSASFKIAYSWATPVVAKIFPATRGNIPTWGTEFAHIVIIRLYPKAFQGQNDEEVTSAIETRSYAFTAYAPRVNTSDADVRSVKTAEKPDLDPPGTPPPAYSPTIETGSYFFTEGTGTYVSGVDSLGTAEMENLYRPATPPPAYDTKEHKA